MEAGFTVDNGLFKPTIKTTTIVQFNFHYSNKVSNYCSDSESYTKQLIGVNTVAVFHIKPKNNVHI